MFFNIPGGLLNTDGVPISVAPGPDWMSASIGIVAVLAVIALLAMLTRGYWRSWRRWAPGQARRRMLRRSRRLTPAGAYRTPPRLVSI